MSNLLTAEVQTLLQLINEHTLLLCVGNSWRADDGVGPYLALRLKPRCPVKIINAGGSPENYLDQMIAAKPENIIVFDAADFKGKAGQVRLLAEAAIPDTTLTTHSISLKILYHLLRKNTRANVHFVGIQLQSIEFSEELSPTVKESAEEIIGIINAL